MANNKPSPLKILGFGIAEVVGLLAVFALILGALNYFNILSLSQIYPNLFGSLPHQTIPQTKDQNKESALIIHCPVAKEYCFSGKAFFNGQYTGLGFNLPAGTKLLAVFDGDLRREFSSLGHRGLVLKNNQTEVNYIFNGEYSLPRSPSKDINFEARVNLKEEIATLSGKVLGSNYKEANINLFFYVLKNSKPLNFSAKDFKP